MAHGAKTDLAIKAVLDLKTGQQHERVCPFHGELYFFLKVVCVGSVCNRVILSHKIRVDHQRRQGVVQDTPL